MPRRRPTSPGRPRAATSALLSRVSWVSLVSLVACAGETPSQEPVAAPTIPVVDSPRVATPPLEPARAPAGPGDPSVAVVFDGDTREWPEGVLATYDRAYLYLRFAPSGAPWTLQAGPVTTVISLDVDASAETGRARDGGELGPLGVDLEIQLSPGDTGVAPGRGVQVTSFDASGRAHASSHAEVGFSFAPTYASATYEARVRRAPSGALPRGIAGPVRALVETRGRAAAARSLREEVRLDVGGLAGAPLAGGIPAAPPSGLRVMSYNVLRTSPRATPRPFARVIRALRPDVLLVQEWDGFDARALHRWASEQLGAPWGAGDWYTHSAPQDGVALISAHPIERALAIDLPRGAGGGRPRFAGAIIRTPLGRGLFASVHLKCCGTLGSPEDEQRVAEATAIYARAQALQREHGLDFVVIGGDLNLVGSRAPLDALTGRERAAASADAPLRVTTPYVLGDGGCHTWRGDAESPFSPGRLDYVVATASALAEARAFTLDSGRLSPEALTRYGLEATDTDASDHLPLVVELTRRASP
ncbi:MAG: endonuclease/exonuclease/phosphatase family protein [Myxococcales bacterium]|nr:endonuclease/exonuclease/phosphatase family protein [Myxococcales bacterium]